MIHVSDHRQWEIQELGAGCTVQRVSLSIYFDHPLTASEQPQTQVEPGKPEQFCTALEGIENHKTLRVSAYPAAWRVKIVDDDNHRGFEYVRSD